MGHNSFRLSTTANEAEENWWEKLQRDQQWQQREEWGQRKHLKTVKTIRRWQNCSKKRGLQVGKKGTIHFVILQLEMRQRKIDGKDYKKDKTKEREWRMVSKKESKKKWKRNDQEVTKNTPRWLMVGKEMYKRRAQFIFLTPQGNEVEKNDGKTTKRQQRKQREMESKTKSKEYGRRKKGGDDNFFFFNREDGSRKRKVSNNVPFSQRKWNREKLDRGNTTWGTCKMKWRR